MSIAIRSENVTKHYGDVRAVDNVSFAVYEGEIGMAGSNDAGKNTLMVGEALLLL